MTQSRYFWLLHPKFHAALFNDFVAHFHSGYTPSYAAVVLAFEILPTKNNIRIGLVDAHCAFLWDPEG